MHTAIFETSCASIIDHIDNGILLLDSTNCILKWNQFMARHSGIQSQAILNKNIFEVFPDLPRAWLELKLKSVRLLKNYSFISWTQRPYLFQFSAKNQIIGDSLEFMFQDSTFFPVTDPDTGDTGVCIVIKDVTDMAQANRQIEEMKDITQTLSNIANFDPMTGIFNRSHIEQLLKMEFKRAERYKSEFSIILFDIDYFKKVNDTYGHLAGDEVLKQLCQAVSHQLRDSDLFGRFGGEEFLIILPNASAPCAKIVSEKLRRLVESLTIPFNEWKIQITISQGLVSYQEKMTDPLQMIYESDLAMYHSKKQGRNRASQFMFNEQCSVTL
ncbi:diguanylate cyclase [Desulfoluna sp.]|uniref:sensor domain-containing diguanylate cyclase n=1 Tax=Desulfoluna sp. TaxID=2045199 RepID=UPI0026163AFC|nr:diguanylate cyclase [Desulfoluna sp.]